MKRRHWTSAVGLALALSPLAAAQAALESRLGGLAYYDTVLDVTWLANANAAAGSAFDDGSNTIDGRLSWASAVSWAASLEVNGLTEWRLPSMDVDGDGAVEDCAVASQAACLDNEYGYHFYWNGIDDQNPAPFTEVQTTNYWSGTEAGSSAWLFDFTFNDGSQLTTSKNFNAAAWAVHAGDVALVPVPAAGWLLAGALPMLLGAGRSLGGSRGRRRGV